MFVRRNAIRSSTGALLALAAFLFAFALAAAPQLHEQIHPNSAASTHECAVTLFVAGSYEHASPPATASAPDVAEESAILTPSAIAIAQSLDFSLLEHAPPALS